MSSRRVDSWGCPARERQASLPISGAEAVGNCSAGLGEARPIANSSETRAHDTFSRLLKKPYRERKSSLFVEDLRSPGGFSAISRCRKAADAALGRFRADSSCRQQPRQPDQIVSRGPEHKHPLHPVHPAQFGLRHAADLLDPAVCLLDPLANDLADP